MATKTQRLKALTAATERAHRAQEAADKALTKRDQAVMAARNPADPATYQEIADAMGLTKDRVSQIIQAQRKGSA